MSERARGGSPSRERGAELSPCADQVAAARWRVWREDEHGHRFEVSRGHTEDEARRIVEDFERRGHKQSYGAEREP